MVWVGSFWSVVAIAFMCLLVPIKVAFLGALPLALCMFLVGAQLGVCLTANYLIGRQQQQHNSNHNLTYVPRIRTQAQCAVTIKILKSLTLSMQTRIQ